MDLVPHNKQIASLHLDSAEWNILYVGLTELEIHDEFANVNLTEQSCMKISDAISNNEDLFFEIEKEYKAYEFGEEDYEEIIKYWQSVAIFFRDCKGCNK